MKLFLKISGGILAAIILAAVVGYLVLPSTYEVSTSLIVKHSPEEIQRAVSDLKTWDSWSAWSSKDGVMKGMEVTYGTPSAGKGASYTWTHPDGNGSLKVTDVEPSKVVKFEVQFADFDPMKPEIQTEVVDGGTKITWIAKGDANGIGRFAFAMLEDAMKDDFSKCLSGLDKYLTDKAAAVAN